MEVPEVVERALGEGTFTVEKFVDSFGVLVEATEGVYRLREMVRTMAFTGRLLRPCASDSTVELTLMKVKEAWAGRQRKEVLPAVSADEVPVSPSHWAWVRLGNLAEVVGGVTKGRDLKGRKRTSLPYLRVANVQRGFLDLGEMKEIEIAEEELPKYSLKPGDVLFTEGGDWDKLGRSAIWEDQIKPCIHQNHVFRARFVLPQWPPAWFSAFANSPVGRSYFENASKRTTNLASINMTQLRNCPMPLPPLAEQKRIVARVDQLMALIDQLEAKQNRKREVGARFAKASLEAITTAESPQEFTAAWTRAQSTWASIVDHPDKVAEIKKAILDLAIHGRLTHQDPDDEPAARLLSRMSVERGGPKTPGPHDGKSPQMPFGLPESWAWAELAETWRVVTDGDHQPPPKAESGVAFLTIGNVSGGRIDFTDTRFVGRSYFDSLDRNRLPARGDLLYTVVGSFGIPVLVDTNVEFCIQRHIAILKPLKETNVAFMYYLMKSGFVYRQAAAVVTGIAQPTLGLGVLRRLLIPIPPLAEQKRVVAKVEHLMKLCDGLEAALRRSEDRAAKLVEAVVQEMVA